MSEKMIREFSSGAVVLRKLHGAWHIAVIEPRIRYGDDNTHPKKIIALPKGNIDPGETPAETALREVHEETGIEATLVDKLADIKYFYRRGWSDNARVFKIVSFFLFRYVSGRCGNIKEAMKIEVAHAFWMPLADAPKQLSYRGERDVAKKANEYVKEHRAMLEAHKH